MRVEKEIRFIYGHRVPFHRSVCKGVHGHDAKVVVTLEGEVKEIRGESDDGMVLDFADIKRVLMEKVHDPWDHGFIVYDGDIKLRRLLDEIGNYKTIVVSFIPTAENLAKYLFNLLYKEYKRIYSDDLELVRLEFWETTTSRAIATKDDLHL